MKEAYNYQKELIMGEEINLERIECFGDCYQLNFRYEESGKFERCFIRKDVLFALMTVAEKEQRNKNSVTVQQQPADEGDHGAA
jgi:hypothetical protein